MLNFLNFSIKFIIIFIGIVIFFVFSTLWYFSIGLPDYKKLSDYQPPISSRVYSEDSKLIAEYALEKRLFIPYESIPEKVINSFLSAEDKNFFSHPGIDAKGILRAVFNNVKNITQNRETEPKKETSKIKSINTLKITSFDDLIKICNENKEIKLKVFEN